MSLFVMVAKYFQSRTMAGLNCPRSLSFSMYDFLCCQAKNTSLYCCDLLHVEDDFAPVSQCGCIPTEFTVCVGVVIGRGAAPRIG